MPPQAVYRRWRHDRKRNDGKRNDGKRERNREMAERREDEKGVSLRFRAVETADELPETVDEDEQPEELPGAADAENLRGRPGGQPGGAQGGRPGGAQEKAGSAAGINSGREDGRTAAGNFSADWIGTGLRRRQRYYRKVLRELVPWLAAFLILLAAVWGTAAAAGKQQEARRAELSQRYGVQYEWK